MTGLTTLSGAALRPYAFGTMQFGGRADETASQEMFEDARAAGIAHFDTAWVYTDGRSEELLGALVRTAREELFVATKVGYTGGAGRENMLAQFDQSRRRLGLDQVDLLYLHRFDAETDLRETVRTFAELKEDGRIRFVGLSNFAAWQVMKAQAIAGTLGIRIDVLQPMYNLVKRQAEVEILPMCADQGIVPVTYSPLGGGLLTGKYEDGGAGRLTEDERYARRYGQKPMQDAATGLAAIARREKVHPATLAVAWVATGPFGAHPILSARDRAQLAPSLAALDFALSPELRAEITALMPTPPPATDRIEER